MAMNTDIAAQEEKNPAKPISVIKFSRKAMTRYGKYVIEDRALPDFRDGLKPVQRKLLWAMYDMGVNANAKRTKSARIVGEVIGKWHPHGDKAAYDALVTANNLALPLADGEGNWGGGIMDDPPASMRYTNTRMSKFAQVNFFNTDYVPVCDMVPNYDDSLLEPVILPSLLPNLFANGSFGIGVAVTSEIPSYTVDSLKKIVTGILQGKEITPKACAKTLKFNYPLGGGECISDEKTLVDFYKANSGAVEFKSLYKWDEKKRKMMFYSFAPGLNVPNILAFILGRGNGKRKPPVWTKHVQDAQDESSKSDGQCCSVTFKKGSSAKEVEVCVKYVEDLFTSRVNYKINVTERVFENGEVDVKFHPTTVPALLTKWCGWRVDLEKKMLNYKLGVNAKHQKHTGLLILACANIKVIVKALEEDAPEQYLMKQLKITEADANVILDLKVRNLSKLDNKKLQEKLDSLKSEEKELHKHLKNPSEKIVSDLAAMKAM